MTNESHSPHSLNLPYSEKVVETIALVLILVVSTVLNIIVCSIISQNKALKRRPANVFVANLCLSNMVLTWFVVPFSLATLMWNKHAAYTGPACTFNGFFSVASCCAIVFTLCCISIDRYIAVTKPTRYRTIMTTKQAFYMLTFTWFLSLLLALFPVLGWSHYEYHPGTLHCSPSFISNCSLYIFLSVLGFFIPIVLMVITYIKIFHVIRKHSRIVTSLKMTSHAPVCPIQNTLAEELHGKEAHSQNSRRSLLLGLQNSKRREVLADNDSPLSPSSIITTSNEEPSSQRSSTMNHDTLLPNDSIVLYDESVAGPFYIDNQGLQEKQQVANATRDEKTNSDYLKFQEGSSNFRGAKKTRRARIASKEYKIAKTGLLLLILFLTLWLPYLVVNSCFARMHPPERVFHFAMCLVYMNGVANPIAYAFNNAIVKTNLRRIFGRIVQLFCDHQ